MPQRSAGIVLYRRHRHGGVEVLLVHPGGPYWAGRTRVPGVFPRAATSRARTRWRRPGGSSRRRPASAATGGAIALGSFRQSAAKTVDAWAVEGDFDPAGLDEQHLRHGMAAAFGAHGEFPEVDRAEWFTPAEAARKILEGQRPILRPCCATWARGGGGEAGGVALPDTRHPDQHRRRRPRARNRVLHGAARAEDGAAVRGRRCRAGGRGGAVLSPVKPRARW